MGKEVLMTRKFHRHGLVNPFTYGCHACRYLVFVAVVDHEQPPERTATFLYEGKGTMRVSVCISLRNMVMDPAFAFRTAEFPEAGRPLQCISSDFELPRRGRREFAKKKAVEMLARLNCGKESVERVRKHLPAFLVEAATEARLGGFSSLQVEIDVVETNQYAAMDVQFMLKAAMNARIVEAVKARAPEELCAICLDGLAEGMVASKLTLCSHVFHSDCIGKCLKHAFKTGLGACRCPLCRSQLRTQN